MPPALPVFERHLCFHPYPDSADSVNANNLVHIEQCWWVPIQMLSPTTTVLLRRNLCLTEIPVKSFYSRQDPFIRTVSLETLFTRHAARKNLQIFLLDCLHLPGISAQGEASLPPMGRTSHVEMSVLRSSQPLQRTSCRTYTIPGAIGWPIY